MIEAFGERCCCSMWRKCLIIYTCLYEGTLTLRVILVVLAVAAHAADMSSYSAQPQAEGVVLGGMRATPSHEHLNIPLPSKIVLPTTSSDFNSVLWIVLNICRRMEQ